MINIRQFIGQNILLKKNICSFGKCTTLYTEFKVLAVSPSDEYAKVLADGNSVGVWVESSKVLDAFLEVLP